MRITLDQNILNRDAERARIARWFGDSAIGPVYFVSPDRPVPVSAEERDLWLARAQRLADRHAAQQRWVGFEAIVMAFVLMEAMGFATEMLGGMVPALRSIPPLYAAIGGLVWPLVHALLYRRRLGALRREIADRLHMRSALDVSWVPRGKRYNLFSVASLAMVLGIIGWTAIAALRGGQGDGMTPSLVLLPVALVMHLAARRVDEVQRRRLS